MEQRTSTHKSRIVQVGITQMTCTPDAEENLRKQVRLVEEAARKGAQIICTQELFRSLYFCQCEDRHGAEPRVGEDGRIEFRGLPRLALVEPEAGGELALGRHGLSP